jgi:hypothetical protein
MPYAGSPYLAAFTPAVSRAHVALRRVERVRHINPKHPGAHPMTALLLVIAVALLLALGVWYLRRPSFRRTRFGRWVLARAARREIERLAKSWEG